MRSRCLGLFDSAGGASASASAAVDAAVSVDNKNAAGIFDGVGRTFASASAAADALGTNFVSHKIYLLEMIFTTLILNEKSKISKSFVIFSCRLWKNCALVFAGSMVN